jgi:hypothetical protein
MAWSTSADISQQRLNVGFKAELQRLDELALGVIGDHHIDRHDPARRPIDDLADAGVELPGVVQVERVRGDGRLPVGPPVRRLEPPAAADVRVIVGPILDQPIA